MAVIETVTSATLEPQVLQATNPVVLDFYQASCPPCRMLEPRLERVAEQYAGQVQVYRVDVDQDLGAAEHFDVTSLPTVLIFRRGSEVARLDGLISEEQLRRSFDQVLRG